MSYLTRDEFLKMQAERQARANAPKKEGPRVGYFSMKDGDEAIVRFAASTDGLNVYPVHGTRIDGKYRTVSCLRNSLKESADTCPLCAAGEKFSYKIYIPVVEYVRAEDGSVVANAKVWERPATFMQTLSDFEAEYGDLKDMIFKIKRTGSGLDTKYSVLPANQAVYNAQIYVKDFTPFEGYEVLGGPVKQMSFDEMAKIANGGHEGQTFTPQVNTAPEATTRITY